ncbi:hypothetical protein VW29_18735, partial [Devosia limi DSM 17137]
MGAGGSAAGAWVARCGKEVSVGVDDAQLRDLAERLVSVRELEARWAAISASVEGQGELTEALRVSMLCAATRAALADRYRPYRPRRRTKAEIARERG